jgi:transcriptional regulator with XRE-family HTH domain
MPKPTSTVQCSGETVTRLRTQLGMTQEKLAAMSNVDIRTVQRAEKGQRMQIETVASLASALKVTVPELSVKARINADESPHQDEVDYEEIPERNAVALHQVTSGKSLLDIVYGSFSGQLSCNVEPTDENVEALSSMVEELEGLIPNPWALPPAFPITLAQRLRAAVALTARLKTLEALGVGVYAGTYTAMTQVPRVDGETYDQMYTTRSTPFEPVILCRITLDKSGFSGITLFVDDKWTEPEPPDPDDAPF